MKGGGGGGWSGSGDAVRFMDTAETVRVVLTVAAVRICVCVVCLGKRELKVEGKDDHCIIILYTKQLSQNILGTPRNCPGYC